MIALLASAPNCPAYHGEFGQWHEVFQVQDGEVASRARRVESGTQDSPTKKKPLDPSANVSYTDHMFPRVDPALLLANLNKVLAESGLKPVKPNVIAAIIEKSAPRPSQDDGRIVDPIHGLPLPPIPEVTYRDRAKKYGSNIGLDDFLEREGWNKYRNTGLLCSAFIRRDPSLYQAFTDKAKWRGITTTEIMREYGILTRNEIVNPSPDMIDNVRLIQAALVGSRHGSERAA